MTLKQLKKQLETETKQINADIEALCKKWGFSSYYTLEYKLKENYDKVLKIDRLIDATDDLVNPKPQEEETD